MNKSYDILNRIRERLSELNRSERKVAEVILQNPDAVTRLSIAALAHTATVSEPTVNRFCRSLNTKGYPDFKIKLAQSLACGTLYVSSAIESEDNAAAFTSKIFGASIAAIDRASQQLDIQLIERAVDYLAQARQLFFFGLGASVPIIEDAYRKFFRFNLPVFSYSDILMQRMTASIMSTGDVLIVISHTGRTRELVEISTIARNNGAVIIGITEANSPLAQQCSEVISVEPSEDTELYIPMTSRLVHLVLLDILAAGVTLKRGKDFIPHLKKIKESVKATKFPLKNK